LGVEPSGVWFIIFFETKLPIRFEHEHVRELRFFAQTPGNFPTGGKAQAAANRRRFLPWRSTLPKNSGKQSFIGLHSTKIAPALIARELIVRTRIDPNNISAPCAGLIDGSQFRRKIADRNDILWRK